VDQGLPMVKGLREWIQWIDERGIKKCAVTNAPRKNAEVMLEALGLE
jgi:phosphoglycolate phosphatase-like HAD superfamily hydrolase